MNHAKLFPGDTAVINGARVTADQTTTLSSDAKIERIPSPGITDLPDTDLRIRGLWGRHGHRVPMTYRHDLRCPCGSAYVRQSATHHSCQHCGRAWTNEDIPAKAIAAER